MRKYVEDADFMLWHGDALEVLRAMPAVSVDCCVTSPPYWGLRDYGHAGQLGLEQTPDEYVARLVDVFREVRRCLTDAGTLWLNLGDSYAAANNRNDGTRQVGSQPDSERDSSLQFNHGTYRKVPSLKHKDLVGIPWRVAFALQADGWYLRSDIVWSKPNPMPESVTDRPTKSHEYVFLLSKSPRYWFDQEAVREPSLDPVDDRRVRGDLNGYNRKHTEGGTSAFRTRDIASVALRIAAGRNIRSVWEIATQPYPEAHFAVFPEELPRRCILAGCPEWVCVTCGKARERVLNLTHDKSSPKSDSDFFGDGRDPGVHRKLGSAYQKKLNAADRHSTWSHCAHSTNAANLRPGIVLDPFGGSGTTALVARKHGRRSILIELNEDYCRLAATRLQQLSLLAEPA